ncbi:MAG: aminotransferase class V-fold PLP-dependent enzyme [Pirellulales bacterium]|nr:aminotransferase class V-fold PLP-dependent enzyme [Pirellulales bacterium]
MHPAFPSKPAGSEHAALWPLDPEVVFVNHGSFGACPSAVLARQAELRGRMEAEPVRFLAREAQELLDASRQALADLVGAKADDLVFVPNVTTAFSSVLRSLRFAPGDEILVTDHDYNACRNAARFVALQSGAEVVVARVPLPIDSPEAVVQAVLASVTPRTRLAVLDHVTSPTALVFPIERLVRELDARGIDALVDGAHAPGMVPVDLNALGAAYYTGNCHKWLCAPKGAGFLHVRPDRQEGIHPAAITHGLNRRRAGSPRLHDEFDWPGTVDPSPWICVGEAIRFLDDRFGGLSALMARNHRLAIKARAILCDALGVAPLAPEAMLGSMAAVRLPDANGPVRMETPGAAVEFHPLQTALLRQYGIEVPLYFWPAEPARLLRISAAAYNSPGQYAYLAEALRRLLAEE